MVQVADDSTPKWWNLDLYFAEIISSNLRDFIANSHTIPFGMSESEWKAKLDSIASRLEKYKTIFEPEDKSEDIENAQQAIRDLADIFPRLWD